MPQMDGPALIREVRRIDPDIKVIFISGYTEDAFRQRLDSDSDIHFLAKPFSLKQLAIKVKEVIGETCDWRREFPIAYPNKTSTLLPPARVARRRRL